MKIRKANIKRITKETQVNCKLSIDGRGITKVKTGINFLDHLIVSFAKHSMIDLELEGKSLDKIDHHLIEDVGISIGMAIDKALGERKGITRFGHFAVPMDESLSEATVDLVKRPYSKISVSIKRNKIEGVSREDLKHFLQSLVQNLNSCVHISVKYGENDHHKIESAIKSLAIALRYAMQEDKKQKGIPSTKGAM